MEKNIEIAMLYDIYGKLLTKRQQDIFEEYYLYNLSLREIALNKNISYQAVRDSLKTSETMLASIEVKVGMQILLNNVKKVINICENSTDLNSDRETLKSLLSIKSEDDI